MQLAIFDLDETLINVDSDVEWGRFLNDEGVTKAKDWNSRNEMFYSQYKKGTLDIYAYLEFVCEPLKELKLDTLLVYRKRFIEQRIKPNILEKGQALLDVHRKAGHEILIITATIEFLTKPIASLMGVEHLIAPIPEFLEGGFTGRTIGTPSFGEGKVVRLTQWIENQNEIVDQVSFYSDSHNDLPLLLAADNAIAVDPDPLLLEEAKKRDWSVISLR
jgi:HAD superfamily hydrolase (TIGR01490 family)